MNSKSISQKEACLKRYKLWKLLYKIKYVNLMMSSHLSDSHNFILIVKKNKEFLKYNNYPKSLRTLFIRSAVLSSSMLLIKRPSVGESAKGSGMISFANVPHVDEPALRCTLFIGIGIINLAMDSSSQQVLLLLHVSDVFGNFLFTIFEVSGKGGCNLVVRGVVGLGSGVCFWVDNVAFEVGGVGF